MKKLPYLGIMVGSAFLAFVSFAQIDSAASDKHHLNPLWWVLGIASAISTFLFLYLAAKTPKA